MSMQDHAPVLVSRQQTRLVAEDALPPVPAEEVAAKNRFNIRKLQVASGRSVTFFLPSRQKVCQNLDTPFFLLIIS